MTPDTSYQGVQFTVGQQAILNRDIDTILRLEQERRDLDAKVAGEHGNIAFANDNLSSCWTNLGPGQAQDNCVDNWQREKEAAEARLANINSPQIPTKDAQIAAAKAQYNADLEQIQNQIKLSIQASIENARNAAQAAANAVAVNKSNPVLLAEQLKLQATLDKQKRDQQMKIVGFILITIIVLGIGWYVIKKLLA